MLHTPNFQARSYDFCEYIPARNFIGGRWLDAVSAETVPIMNPRHGQPMSKVPLCGAVEVDAAVSAAATAFPSWRATPIRERAQVMYRLKSFLERDLEELSWLVCHENGKTIEESRASVLKAIECVEFGCALPNLAAGELLDVSRGVSCQTVHESLGVCAGITPFNFPLMVPLWMIPQCVVGGNSFVLKASEQVPLSAMRLMELLREAELPDGVVNLVHGGRDAVEALADHPNIKALGFVGSTRVAKAVYGRAAATGKRALCLGGAKNHLFLLPDADRTLSAENGVNVGVPVPREPFGFGGWNDSKFGHGDITGIDGFRFWTRARKLTSKWAEQSDRTWMS